MSIPAPVGLFVVVVVVIVVRFLALGRLHQKVSRGLNQARKPPPKTCLKKKKKVEIIRPRATAERVYPR